MDKPSPYVSIYISRRQAEMLLAFVRASPLKKWRPVARMILGALRKNANGKEYPDVEEPRL